MYATRTTFAAATAVMAAKVELPMDASRSEDDAKGSRQRRTVPYVLLRCEIRCDRDDTERETEEDKLEKYPRAVDGTPNEWEKP